MASTETPDRSPRVGPDPFPDSGSSPDPGPTPDGAAGETDSGRSADALRRYAVYSGLAVVFPAAAVFGLWAGRTIAGWLGAEPGLGSVLGLLAGVAGAFYNLFATIGRTERRGGDDPPS